MPTLATPGAAAADRARAKPGDVYLFYSPPIIKNQAHDLIEGGNLAAPPPLSFSLAFSLHSLHHNLLRTDQEETIATP